MADDQFLVPTDAFELEPPVGVPEPAPLDMPRRRIRRFPFDFARLMPGSPALVRRPQDARIGSS